MIRSLLLALALIASPAVAGPLTVMTYNVRVDVEVDNPRWAVRRDPMARQIAFVAPDLLGVQEAKPEAIDDLAARLPGYDHYGIGRDDGKLGESTTIFWRRDRFDVVSQETQWCSPTPDVPSKGWDAALPRTITRLVLKDRDSGRLLDVRNTHFDHIGEVAREMCARQIEAWPRAKDSAVVVMGDFNSTPDSAPYAVLTAPGGLNLKDARVGAAVDFGPVGTFNAFDIKGTDQAIDHVFVDQATKVLRYGVLTDSVAGLVISDHFPVVATLEVP